MRAVVQFTAVETRAGDPEILARLHVPRGATVSARLHDLLGEGRQLFDDLAAPIAVVEEVPRDEFARIYVGEGRNATVSPLEAIAPRAERIALFAGTVGPAIDASIRRNFRDGDAAMAYVLDAFAADAANRVTELTTRAFMALAGDTATLYALPYSPGYCGWHVTGQRKLFARVHPEEIGIVLNESCLMRPLKSVSGAIVTGEREIHRFEPAYPFCAACTTHECRGRMRAARSGTPWTS